MNKIWLAILIYGLAANTDFAQAAECQPRRHAKLPIITNLPYPKARTRLLAARWRPVQTLPNSAGAGNVALSGEGYSLWRRGYREIAGCAGTGVAPCVFNFQDAYGNKLQVVTEGQNTPVVSRFHFWCK